MVQDVHGRGAREMLRIQEVDVKKGEGFKYLQSGVRATECQKEVKKCVQQVETGGEKCWQE